MKITLEIPDEKMYQLAKDIMENYPEFSSCNVLQCVKWDYKKETYIFVNDEEEDAPKYTVTVKEIADKGLPFFINGCLKGDFHFCGLEKLEELLDPCCYDSPGVDAVVQLTIFGDLIYG